MKLLLVDRIPARVGKRITGVNVHPTFYFVLNKATPSSLGVDDDCAESKMKRNLFSEMTEDKQCVTRVIISPLADGNYEMLVRNSKVGAYVLKNLQKRFQDSVMISVEICSTSTSTTRTPDNSNEDAVSGLEDAGNLNDRNSCVSSKGMLISGVHNQCKAHSRYMRKFDLEELDRSTTFHVEVTAHIDDACIIPNAYEVLKTNQKILGEDMASDVIITAENGVEIRSHKCFLVSRSSVLQRMLEGEMAESKTRCIDMTDISEEGIKAFFRYLYHGEVQDCSIDLTYNLLYAAHKYDVPKLEKEMQMSLLARHDEDFDANIAFKIYSFVRGIETASELKDKVIKIMHWKFEELKETPEFKEVFQKNPADAIEICSNLVRVKSPSNKRKLDSESEETGKKSRIVEEQES